MVTVLLFGTTLILAVLISQVAHKTVISTAVLFLVVGFLAGPGVLHVTTITTSQPYVRDLANLALFSILFTDGLSTGLPELRSAWRLPGRALLLGLPLTLGAIALLARTVGGLSWTGSFLLGAVLSPTDPVFAAAIVTRKEVPSRLRHLLNVESGMNDGIALPIVIVLLAVSRSGHLDVMRLGGHLALGVLLGVAVPWTYIRLERSRYFSASALYEPLGPFAIGLILLALCQVTGSNEFLAAFFGGITIASTSDAAKEAFHHFGELVAELLKLAALLAFGALVTPMLLRHVGVGGWVFAVATILVARPASLELSLMRSELIGKERAAAAWFGPKGFASVVYGLLVLASGGTGSVRIFSLTVITVAVSIVAHSSSDTIVARWLQDVSE